MVRGLDVFKNHFEQYTDNYVIIGGTACDIIIDEAGFTPRATKDIDIILVIEALSSAFVEQFWNFIHEGKYEIREKSDSNRQYYRFTKPENKEFPYQIELFSRIPDILNLAQKSRYTLIPVDEDITSLSAILMNEAYYHFTINGSTVQDGVRIANTETLICLKARAFNDLKTAKENGESIDYKKINKHKTDVFRLAFMLNPDDLYETPESIKADLQVFANIVKNELPPPDIFKENGFGKQNMSLIFKQLKKSFYLISNE